MRQPLNNGRLTFLRWIMTFARHVKYASILSLPFRQPFTSIGVLLTAGIPILAGCAHCQVATIYKPLVHRDSQFRIDPGVPTHVGVTLEGMPFTIAVCGERYLAPPGDTVALCISVELDAEDALRFSEPTVTIETGGSPPKAISMTAVEYEIHCWVEKGKRSCTSSEESPIAGQVTKVSGTGTIDRYAFDPAFEFRGARDTLHEGAWFGYRSAGKRNYFVRTLSIPVPKGAELTVQLPEMILNGQVLTPPELKFHAVTEEVCRMLPLT